MHAVVAWFPSDRWHAGRHGVVVRMRNFKARSLVWRAILLPEQVVPDSVRRHPDEIETDRARHHRVG